MNYGHPLEFGTLITPGSAFSGEAVELAVLSERYGYDIVTVREDPDQSELLDPWTLMSWIAGRTERIRVGSSVMSMLAQTPAVAARAAASLDLLSGGRFTLALGSGTAWNARGTHDPAFLGTETAAVEEVIEIIRNMWSSEQGNLRYSGDYYRVEGTPRGPEPAHEVPIWLAGLDQSMLRLIGRESDGWLSSAADMIPGQFAAANQAIDEAARQAGRDPREIRRLVNISGDFRSSRTGFLVGPSNQWIEELLPFVVDEGVGTFILETDDAATMRQFAEEVIPGLRAAADLALPGDLTGGKIRRASVRARRAPGIAYEAVPASIADHVIEPGDVGYGTVRSTYLRGGAPGLVIQPRHTAGVVDAIGFARKHPDLPLGIRSGGHGISGRSTNRDGIVIDLSRLNTIEVLDVEARIVRIEPGARWMDVAAALSEHGWALSSGDYGGVGVGGLATTGGIGFLGREHGLTIDHLRAVEIVLADGTVARASDTENEHLFWAVRGAGANFGIVTAFEFEVDEVAEVGWAQFVMDAGDTADFLQKWGATVEAAPRDTTSFLILGAPRPDEPAIATVMTMVDSADPEVIVQRLQPFADISLLHQQSVQLTTYRAVISNAAGQSNQGQGEPVSRSGFLEHITPEFARSASRLIHSGATHFFQVRSVGGAVSDVDPDATAYAHRSANFSVVAFASRQERLNAHWAELYPHFDGLYLSFETDQDPARIEDAFPPRTLARLRRLKAEYDPNNLFNDNFNVVDTEIWSAS
ncbi:LLM class flavin-dependent oxidoreductase [Microbacterium sp. A84]|uniref:LLM class flavin-dependent oxidoreductase n=1 Tax=Microbacterium sp. A84 TaxID=3450715 RepID=UPI003F437DE1